MPGFWDRGGQAPEKLDRLEDDVTLAGVPWFAQLQAELAVLGPALGGDPSCGQWNVREDSRADNGDIYAAFLPVP